MRVLLLVSGLFLISNLSFADDQQDFQNRPTPPKSGTIGLVRAGLLMDWPAFNMLIAGGGIGHDAESDNPLSERFPVDNSFGIEYFFGWRF